MIRKLTDEEEESIHVLERLANRLEQLGQENKAGNTRRQAQDIRHRLEHDEDETVLHHRENEAFRYLFDKETMQWKRPRKPIKYRGRLQHGWRNIAELYPFAENEWVVKLTPQDSMNTFSSEQREKMRNDGIRIELVGSREIMPSGVRFTLFILDSSIAKSQEVIPFTGKTRVCDLWKFAQSRNNKNTDGRR